MLATRRMELLLPVEGKTEGNRFLHFVKTVGFSYEIGGNEGSSRKKGKPELETVMSDVPDAVPLFAALSDCFQEAQPLKLYRRPFWVVATVVIRG